MMKIETYRTIPYERLPMQQIRSHRPAQSETNRQCEVYIGGIKHILPKGWRASGDAFNGDSVLFVKGTTSQTSLPHLTQVFDKDLPAGCVRVHVAPAYRSNQLPGDYYYDREKCQTSWTAPTAEASAPPADSLEPLKPPQVATNLQQMKYNQCSALSGWEDHNGGSEGQQGSRQCASGKFCTDYCCALYHPPNRTKICKHGIHCRSTTCEFLHPKGHFKQQSRGIRSLMPTQQRASTPSLVQAISGYCQEQDSSAGLNSPSNPPVKGNTAGHYGQVPACKHGVKCRMYDCSFSHPLGRCGLCRYGRDCLNPHCTYLHPMRRGKRL